eukprot:1372691-Amphidinium_carterae.2
MTLLHVAGLSDHPQSSTPVTPCAWSGYSQRNTAQKQGLIRVPGPMHESVLSGLPKAKTSQ